MIRLALAVLVLLTGCVTRVQVCAQAEHARPQPDWTRQNSFGGSVCADVEPR